MLKFFRIPFATSGDKTAVPDALDASGNVSYTEGYGLDYQRQKTDPAAKNIERDKMNEIFFDITTALGELQSKGVPDFITSALNGGTAYSYAINAIVRYSNDVYLSLANSNTALPSDATKWALIPTAAREQAAAYTAAVAAGTANAITAAFVPAIAALPAAPGTLSVLVRAGAANSTTTPTLSVDGLTAKTIVKGSNSALVAGDIAGAGHWLSLQYDATLDKWVLLNPAKGIAAAEGVPTGTIIDFAGTAAPSGYMACPLVATNISRTTYAALFAAIGTTWGVGDGSTTFGVPYFAADYAAVQANANVGTVTTGDVKAHTHPLTASTNAAGGSSVPSVSGGTGTTGSTGGAANLAAGSRVLKCVKL